MIAKVFAPDYSLRLRMFDPAPADMSPEDFELQVKRELEATGGELSEYRVLHRETLPSPSGEFQIDVTVRFRALQVDFLVLVECKHHARRVEREDVQVLH